MAAKDYRICPALFGAYIAKVSKRDNKMTSDRREIGESEILMLIDWYLDKEADEGEKGLSFKSYTRKGMKIVLCFKKEGE